MGPISTHTQTTKLWRTLVRWAGMDKCKSCTNKWQYKYQQHFAGSMIKMQYLIMKSCNALPKRCFHGLFHRLTDMKTTELWTGILRDSRNKKWHKLSTPITLPYWTKILRRILNDCWAKKELLEKLVPFFFGGGRGEEIKNSHHKFCIQVMVNGRPARQHNAECQKAQPCCTDLSYIYGHRHCVIEHTLIYNN